MQLLRCVCMLSINVHLIIDETVPNNDDHCVCFLLFLDILQFCTCCYFSKVLAGFLDPYMYEHYPILLTAAIQESVLQLRCTDYALHF